MAVNLSPIGNDAPFVDASGNPLSSGNLYTYTAGSSTPQATFTTSLGNVQNANPIVLNANGYPASGGNVVSIWLTAGVNYKFELQNAAGTVIWTRDNISGINDTSSSQDEWVAGPAPTYVSATSFTLVGDQTGIFHKSRRVRTTNSGGTVYSTILTSTFGAVTTVTVANDSGTLDSGLSAISYSLISAANPSIDADMVHRKGSAVASAATCDIWAIAGDFVHVTGSTTITSLGTAPYAGDERTVIFDSAGLTITNNATTLQLPGGQNIVTDAGARATVKADTTANMIVTSYTPATLLSPNPNLLVNSGFEVDQRINSATSRADDVYCLDHWYVLTQTAAIQVTQQTAQENGTPYSIRLTQNQAAAQRMGLAQIIEGKDCKFLRGYIASMAARIRYSNAAAVRYALLEWTSTEDAVTSDVVLDWTSASYTAGGFFLAANLNVLAVGSLTPSAATWTDLTPIVATVGNSANNIIVFIWTEGTAAQNSTLDIGRAWCGQGYNARWVQEPFQTNLARCERFFEKSYNIAVAAGSNTKLGLRFVSSGGSASNMGGGIQFRTRKRATSPTMAYWDGAGNATKMTQRNGAAYTDNTGTPATVNADEGSVVMDTGITSNVAAFVHFTADSEL